MFWSIKLILHYFNKIELEYEVLMLKNEIEQNKCYQSMELYGMGSNLYVISKYYGHYFNASDIHFLCPIP